MARARYSTWLGATKPTFIDTDSQNLVRLQLKRARHPLLLQQHREALRDAKATLKSKSKVRNVFVLDVTSYSRSLSLRCHLVCCLLFGFQGGSLVSSTSCELYSRFILHQDCFFQHRDGTAGFYLVSSLNVN